MVSFVRMMTLPSFANLYSLKSITSPSHSFFFLLTGLKIMERISRLSWQERVVKIVTCQLRRIKYLRSPKILCRLIHILGGKGMVDNHTHQIKKRFVFII